MRPIGKKTEFYDRLPDDLKNRWSDELTIAEVDVPLDKTLVRRTCIGVATHFSARKIVNAAFSTGLRHIVQTQVANYAERVDKSAELILGPRRFLENPAMALLGKDILDQVSFPFSDSKDKDRVLSELRKWLSLQKSLRTVTDSCVRIADEMYTNAIFHGPSHSDGTSRNSKKTRNTAISIPCPAELQITYSERELLLTCTDLFGNFELERLMFRLWNSYNK